jgi:hypothetical protein
MSMSNGFAILLATDNAVLPSAQSMQWALYVIWAMVLCAICMRLTTWLPKSFQWGVGLVVAAWTLLPGSSSPAYWLGLAFQTPSLMSAVICLSFIFRSAMAQELSEPVACARVSSIKIGAGLGVGLGWVLMLDTFALLPVSVYAWGFSAMAVALVALLAMVLWALWGPVQSDWRQYRMFEFAGLFCVIGFFVVTRLPTGNVWDALIDPWLWLGLQGGLISSVVRDFRARSPK